MFDVTVHTEIEIEAPAGRVWDVLADLDHYREWNPMIRSAGGTMRAGERITVHFNPPGSKARTFHPKLLVVQPERELRWQGQPGFPLLFESEHLFLIEPAGNNSVRLIHDMIFYGLLIPPARRKIIGTVGVPFEMMNRALRDRVINAGEAR